MIPRGAGLFCGIALWLAKWNKGCFKGGSCFLDITQNGIAFNFVDCFKSVLKSLPSLLVMRQFHPLP